MGFESMSQAEKKPSEAEMAQEARLKAEQATQRPEGETEADEYKRANELLAETKRAKFLGEIANKKEDISSLQTEIKNMEGDPTQNIKAENLKRKLAMVQEQLAQKQKEYETWDKIERTGSPL